MCPNRADLSGPFFVPSSHTKEIVAWDFDTGATVELALKTLKQIRFYGGSLLHSDQGGTYTSPAYRDEAEKLGITLSYSRKGNCYDNATMECFNGTFKVEALYNPLLQQERPSFKEQNECIGRYIEFYNKQRPCSLIDSLTPEQYRQDYYEKKIQRVSR